MPPQGKAGLPPCKRTFLEALVFSAAQGPALALFCFFSYCFFHLLVGFHFLFLYLMSLAPGFCVWSLIFCIKGAGK